MTYQQQGKRNTKKKKKNKSAEPQPQYMKRLSSWLLPSQLETLYRYFRWFNRQGVVFTEALITCGDKTACDTQLSRSRRRRHHRLAKKRSGDLYMGEVAEHNDKEVGGGATRGRYPNTSSKRSPLAGAADWEPLAPTEYSFPLPARSAARTTAAKQSKKAAPCFSRRTLTDAAAVDCRGSAGAPLLQVDKSANADKHS